MEGLHLYTPLPWKRKIYNLKHSIDQLAQNEKIVVNEEIDSLKTLVADYYVAMLKKTSSVATVKLTLDWLHTLGTMKPYTEVIDDLTRRFPHSKVVNDQIVWFNKYKYTSNEVRKSFLENNILAPDFEFKSLDGTTRRLSSYRGSYILLDFWASWCKPCRLQAPYLKEAFVKYKGEKLQIIQLSMDRPQDVEKWKQAIKDDQIGDFIHTNKYPDDQVYKDYKIGSLPSNYLIGPDGKIIASNLRDERLDVKLKEIFKHGE